MLLGVVGSVPDDEFQSIWQRAWFCTLPAASASSVTVAVKERVVDLPGSSEIPVHSRRFFASL